MLPNLAQIKAKDAVSDSELPVSVVIIDDDVDLCRALKKLFEIDGRIQVLAVSHSPYNAIPLLESHCPDVLLLDIDFDEAISGIDVLKRVKAREDLDVKILIYTIYARDETIFDALRAGANSYVWKDESTEEIADAIINTAQGKAHISTAIAQKMLDHFDQYRHLFADGAPPDWPTEEK